MISISTINGEERLECPFTALLTRTVSPKDNTADCALSLTLPVHLESQVSSSPRLCPNPWQYFSSLKTRPSLSLCVNDQLRESELFLGLSAL